MGPPRSQTGSLVVSTLFAGGLPQIAGASDLLELLYEKRGGKNGYLRSPLMTSTYLFPVLCVSMFAINDYYPPHGVKFIQG